MSFFVAAAGLIGKLATSLGSKLLGEKFNDVKTQRRMGRIVDDAVDRIVEQTEEYLRTEKVDDRRKELLIAILCAKLQPLADNPKRFFIGDLDGDAIFKQCHPDGELPSEIREEQLDQFYTVLFPQVAHFMAGSRIALAEWQAEGYREEFKRLSQLAEEIRAMNVKVTELPSAVADALSTRSTNEADILLREFSQTLLNSLLLRLDLSPLRAERSLHGSLGNHFVVPAIAEKDTLALFSTDAKGILEILAAPGSRRIVHGGAGVGKTTCSLWLQSRLLQTDPIRLAVVFRLREVTDIENMSLLDLLRARAGVHLREALGIEVLRNWHEDGRLVIILDGFDEIPESRRDRVEEWIKSLSAVARKSSIIVTSRPLQSGHLERLPLPWQQWSILPFDEPRIVDFIERWHRYLPDGELSPTERRVDASGLARTFFRDPSLKPLSNTPLMLGTLLFVHHRDKKLPNGRVDLYERYIAAMLGLRDSGLGIEARATKLSDKEKRRVLSQIALDFHLAGVNEVDDKAMNRLINDSLSTFKFEEDPNRLLDALCERTGLLQGPGAWSFMHKTIGEFLVAELICEGTTRLPDQRRLDRKELWAHRHKDAWTAVLFFWAGKTSPRELEEFVEQLVEEATSDSSLLALALLDDQGDRLDFETRRSFALRIIQLPWDSSLDTAFVTSSPVPIAGYREYRCPNRDLRGLSATHSTAALAKLFTQGLLLPQDLSSISSTRLSELTVAVLWSFEKWGSSIDIRDLISLTAISQTDAALFSFDVLFRTRFQSNKSSLEVVINEWLEFFPFARAWMPLLLVGATLDTRSQPPRLSSARKRAFGPILWSFLNQEMDPEWVASSKSWRWWSRGQELDIVGMIDSEMQEESSEAWNVDPEKFEELRQWIALLISQRDDVPIES